MSKLAEQKTGREKLRARDFKKILLLLPLLFISSCSQDMFTLICKFKPGALYTDTLTFNESKSEVLRTSDNRNYSPFSYNARNTDDGYILYGTYYKTDSNGNKTLIEDEDMWVLTKNAPTNKTSLKNDSWEWELYYFDDFKTDPVRFLSCREQ